MTNYHHFRRDCGHQLNAAQTENAVRSHFCHPLLGHHWQLPEYWRAYSPDSMLQLRRSEVNCHARRCRFVAKKSCDLVIWCGMRNIDGTAVVVVSTAGGTRSGATALCRRVSYIAQVVFKYEHNTSRTCEGLL